MEKESVWDRFADLYGECYDQIDRSDSDVKVWNDAFDTLKEGLAAEMKKRKGLLTLEEFDEIFDGKYDIAGWLGDYLDELDLRGCCSALLDAVDWLRENFDWSGGDELELDSYRVSALIGAGYADEAYETAVKWYSSEKNSLSAASLIRACMAAGKDDYAGKVIEAEIPEGTACDEYTCPVFIEAQKYYEKKKDEAGTERCRRELEKFEKDVMSTFSDKADSK
ncbi:MAG: hypothetical protein ACOX6J_02335 [Oscillospiraceae bacterium]|jgi:hypothetical protein